MKLTEFDKVVLKEFRMMCLRTKGRLILPLLMSQFRQWQKAKGINSYPQNPQVYSQSKGGEK